ncbi:MAG TPA: UvrD-helicase domain-containing protein [Phycisphaerae bacterium]
MERMRTNGFIESLLDGLTEPQAQAVQHTEGPLLVLAGAGSGKTRVITRRAAYIVATVARPWEVLAITFTNKAANEMRERIAVLFGEEGRDESRPPGDHRLPGSGMLVCTFHALCARILRIYHAPAGLPRNFTIFDQADRRKVVRDAIVRAELAVANWSPARVEAVISRAKNTMLDAEAFAARAQDWSEKTIARIYRTYETLLAEQQGLDFDDLLLKTARLLDADEAVRTDLEQRYRYVLIDEYQDTNDAQYRIARLLARDRQNICATGDPDQSIYGWRGANIGNILQFEQDYPEAVVVRLEQNYRSTKRILAGASAVIARNRRRKTKELWTENDEGVPIRVCEYDSAEEEARDIARRIAEHKSAGGLLSDVAIFYRVNSLSRLLEEALLHAGVPYQIARGTEFYNRKEIKDVLAYLRVLVNPADETALLRIINVPARGIGDTTVERLQKIAADAGQRVFDILQAPSALAPLGRAAARVAQFADLLRSLAPLAQQPAAVALEQTLSLSGLRAELSQSADEDARQNVDELVTAASEFERTHADSTLVDWLEHTSLLSDVDAVRTEIGAVTLMTLHAAKGLEFPIVYIVALEEGLLPLRHRDDEPDADDEEERRLFFVGMTRAKRELVLAHARYRMHRGITQRQTRSPFLIELPAREIQWLDADLDQDEPSPAHEETNGRTAPALAAGWCKGMLVRHPTFGLGRLLWVQPAGHNTRAGVRFTTGEQKTLILEFAKLVPVDAHEVDS